MRDVVIVFAALLGMVTVGTLARCGGSETPADAGALGWAPAAGRVSEGALGAVSAASQAEAVARAVQMEQFKR